jgi:hypothetical protein
MTVFLKAAGVLKLNSYWFYRIQKAAGAVIREFLKAARGHIKSFPKAAGVDNISQLSH